MRVESLDKLKDIYVRIVRDNTYELGEISFMRLLVDAISEELPYENINSCVEALTIIQYQMISNKEDNVKDVVDWIINNSCLPISTRYMRVNTIERLTDYIKYNVDVFKYFPTISYGIMTDIDSLQSCNQISLLQYNLITFINYENMYKKSFVSDVTVMMTNLSDDEHEELLSLALDASFSYFYEKVMERMTEEQSKEIGDLTQLLKMEAIANAREFIEKPNEFNMKVSLISSTDHIYNMIESVISDFKDYRNIKEDIYIALLNYSLYLVFAVFLKSKDREFIRMIVCSYLRESYFRGDINEI